jgi:hypothetical protein
MTKSLKHNFISVWLFVLLMVCLQSCDDHGTQPEKQKVQFTFSTGTTSDNGRAKDTDLPENTRLKISIETSSGTPVFSNHEIEVLKAGGSYMTDAVELMPGTYVITDFMITNDGELLYATPKAGSPLSAFVTHAVPYNFTVTENTVASVNMQVIDGQEHTPEELGYASFTASVVNILRLSVFTEQGGQPSLTGAAAELRKGKKLINTFSLDASVNTISFEGDPDANYALVVYTKEEARATTFNFKTLKESSGTSPLKMTLEPALILTIESGTYEGEEWEDYFHLALDGEEGTINVNWGDGNKDTGTLPYTGSNEYTDGVYTAIVTGDIHQITNLSGFAYNTYNKAFGGLTNLTALKTYNPSWGAVPLRVDLSKCENLETVFVERYGGPNEEPLDLRTDFKLPAQHNITEFVLYVPGLEDNVTAGELEVMVDNIYHNVSERYIRGGRFIVSPVDNPLPETQQKLDILQNSYGWEIGLNSDDIYEDYPEAGSGKISLEARRENWLRNKFPDLKRKALNGKIAFMN